MMFINTSPRFSIFIYLFSIFIFAILSLAFRHKIHHAEPDPYSSLTALDFSGANRVTSSSIEELVKICGPNLIELNLDHIKNLNDSAVEYIQLYTRKLQILSMKGKT
jgi:hypothetical protein